MAEQRTSLPVLEMCAEGSSAPSDRHGGSAAETAPDRLRRIMDAHYDFIWRTVRFLGVPEEGAEDAAQQVFCVLARKLDKVIDGTEMAFLFSTAYRVASDVRRAARTRPTPIEFDVDALAAQLPLPDELVDRRRAREALQQILEGMPEELRVVFVLFEIEGMTVPEIAALTGIPAGTAASRLRRAREAFQSALVRLRAARARAKRGGST
jgi:RNA polymerase sigma-70 factor (ECF subfamily)